MTRWRRLLPIAVAAGLGAALFGMTDYGFAPEEDHGLAALFRIRGPQPPPPQLAIVRLDDDSLLDLRALPDEPQAWPGMLRRCAEDHPAVRSLMPRVGVDQIPRALQACVIDRLRDAGATAIVFDVAFPANAGRDAGTADLAAAMARHGRVVVRELTRRRAAAFEPLDGDAPLEPLDSIIASHPAIAAAAAGAAPFLLPQPTEIVRQFWVRHPGLAHPVMLPARVVDIVASEALERLAERLARPPPQGSDAGARHRHLVELAAAVVAGQSWPPGLALQDRASIEAVVRVHHGRDYLYFDFFGPAGTVPSLSLWDLLGGEVVAEGRLGQTPLHDAVVFIGRSDPGVPWDRDSFPTAFDEPSGVRLSGVELAATAYANLRYGGALTALPNATRAAALFGLTAAMMLAALAGTIWRGILLASTLAIAWAGIAVASFVLARVWLPLTVPLMVILPLVLLSAALIRYLAAKHSIDIYLPRGLARRLLLGERSDATADVTVMFTDIVGFTTLSERLQASVSPTAVQAFQNSHLSLLAIAIHDQGGEILDFTGDGVMAAWGWPDPVADHAARACRAALAMAAALEADNTRRSTAGEAPVRIRIGIHSGMATGGDIGDAEQRRFTLSGDVVNVTSRVEELGKQLCPDRPTAAILASAATFARCGGEFAFEALGEYPLRGRVRPEPIYRLRPRVTERRTAAAAATAALAIVLGAAAAQAQAPCPGGAAPVARLAGAFGPVAVDGRNVAPRSTGVPLCAGVVVEIGPGARGTILHLSGRTVARLEENSTTRLVASPEPESGIIELLRGTLFFASQVRRTLTIRTPVANAGIEGTEVLLRLGGAGEPAFDLRVYDGSVVVRPPVGPASVAGLPVQRVATGERLLVDAKLGARLEPTPGAEAVSLRAGAGRELAWTLYYPPLFADPAAVARPLAEASRQLAAGKVEAARATLRQIGDGSSDAPLRDALLAVVAVTQGDAEAGLALARSAVERRPGAAVPLLARSYAEQALRQLDAARTSARAATEVEPGNTTAWARLAEVELMFGETRRSREAADRAVALRPTALVFVVQGFARLAAFDAAAARASFAAALDLDSQQPLAHLGTGLAQIRRNDLESGTRSLEIAAGLDPTRSLLRSYLGKAYFEDRRDSAAATQLAIAKDLDPADPTPWLYDAIRKQLGNRPIEALRDLERSIELNGNRAPTRSGLLLDQDRATRAVSLARIYDDLGLIDLGIETAGMALSSDPGNAAAHLALGDLYRYAPRQEAARVSEDLQSLMTAPIGTVPLRPSRTLQDLNIPLPVVGSYLGGTDFTGLFDRDGLYVDFTGLAGTKDTLGNEAATTLRVSRWALSAAQFFYETDGFRPGNDLRHTAQQLRLQGQLTEDLALTVDFLNRDSDFGDLSLDFANVFNRDLRIKSDETRTRAGATWRPSFSTTVLGLVAQGELDRNQTEVLDGFADDQFDERARARQGELAVIKRFEKHALQLGASLYDVDVLSHTQDCIDEEFPCGRLHRSTDASGGSVYLVDSFSPAEQVTLVVGAGLSRFAGSFFDFGSQPEERRTTFEPQLGIIYRPTRTLDLRLAASRTLRRPLPASETLEPTQVAGFNRMFDDRDGTVTSQLGLGATWRASSWLRAGVSAELRDLDVPDLPSDPRDRVLADYEREAGIGGFVAVMPTDRFVASISPQWDLFDQAKSADSDISDLSTSYVPIDLRYFLGEHLVLISRATPYVQDVTVRDGSGTGRETNSGLIWDLSAVVRLFGGRGSISFTVANILDDNFNFQDQSFRSFTRDRHLYAFYPERLALLQVHFPLGPWGP